MSRMKRAGRAVRVRKTRKMKTKKTNHRMNFLIVLRAQVWSFSYCLEASLLDNQYVGQLPSVCCLAFAIVTISFVTSLASSIIHV